MSIHSQALSELADPLKELAQRRLQRAEEDYTQGLQALFQARQSDFQDRNALQTASFKLMAALQKNRSQPKSWVAVGYLLMITGDRLRSRAYLQEALRLEPDNQAAHDLLDSLAEVQRVTLDTQDTLKRLELRQQILTPQDLDTQYDQLEKSIRTVLYQLMQQPHVPQPTLSPEENATLNGQLTEFKTLRERFDQQLQALQKELDTTPLYTLLRPLELLVSRYQDAVEISEMFQEILSQIDQSKWEIKSLIREFNGQHKDVSQGLERKMDECDAIADRLDALADNRIDIRLLEPPYQEMLELLNLLQDLLDERD